MGSAPGRLLHPAGPRAASLRPGPPRPSIPSGQRGEEGLDRLGGALRLLEKQLVAGVGPDHDANVRTLGAQILLADAVQQGAMQSQAAPHSRLNLGRTATAQQAEGGAASEPP